MAWRGRFQLGQTVYLGIITRNALTTPAQPDDCPQMRVLSAAGVTIRNRRIPIRERYIQNGSFYFPLFLNGDFAAGQYEVIYYFTIGSYQGIMQDTFEVVPGGNGDGEITNMHFYQRPHASFLVQSLESGKIVQKRNPTL